MSQAPLPPLPTDRDQYIEALNEYIARGVNVENSKRCLRNILRNSAPDTIEVDSEETALSRAVFERIKKLEELKQSVGIDAQSMINVNAIIEAYKCGDLDVIPRKISLWWGGVNKTGPIAGYPRDLANLLSSWKSENPGGRLWIEEAGPLYQMLSRAEFSVAHEHARGTPVLVCSSIAGTPARAAKKLECVRAAKML